MRGSLFVLLDWSSGCDAAPRLHLRMESRRTMSWITSLAGEGDSVDSEPDQVWRKSLCARQGTW